MQSTTSRWQHSNGRNRSRSLLSTNEAEEAVEHYVCNAMYHRSMASF